MPKNSEPLLTVARCQCGFAWVCKQSMDDDELRECPGCGLEEQTRPYVTKDVRTISI